MGWGSRSVHDVRCSINVSHELMSYCTCSGSVWADCVVVECHRQWSSFFFFFCVCVLAFPQAASNNACFHGLCFLPADGIALGAAATTRLEVEMVVFLAIMLHKVSFCRMEEHLPKS